MVLRGIEDGAETALAYEVPSDRYDSFLKAVDGAARSAGAVPLEEVRLGEGPITESSLNRAWLDEGPDVVRAAEEITGGAEAVG